MACRGSVGIFFSSTPFCTSVRHGLSDDASCCGFVWPTPFFSSPPCQLVPSLWAPKPGSGVWTHRQSSSLSLVLDSDLCTGTGEGYRVMPIPDAHTRLTTNLLCQHWQSFYTSKGSYRPTKDIEEREPHKPMNIHVINTDLPSTICPLSRLQQSTNDNILCKQLPGPCYL